MGGSKPPPQEPIPPPVIQYQEEIDLAEKQAVKARKSRKFGLAQAKALGKQKKETLG